MMASFKQHVLLQPVAGRDRGRRRCTAGTGHVQFGKVDALSDLPSLVLFQGYLRDAMALIDLADGQRPRKTTARPELPLPGDLLAGLAGNGRARAVFDAFPPGKRGEHVQWILDAKRMQTRAARVAQAVEWMGRRQAAQLEVRQRLSQLHDAPGQQARQPAR